MKADHPRQAVLNQKSSTFSAAKKRKKITALIIRRAKIIYCLDLFYKKEFFA